MRKVLSFVLVLSLVLGSFSMAFAATPATGLSDIDASANSEAIQVAYDLGIVTGNPDGTFLPEKAVTRAEFAAMITRALAIPESALAGYTATNFKDTAGYGWAVPYLAFAESKGIMLGDGAGNVMPGRTINTNEAMTMALRAVGYTSNSAELVGAWPANYVTLAQNVGLYDDVAAVVSVDKANAAQVIYNALTVQKVSVNANGDTKYLEKSSTVVANLLNTGLGATEVAAKVLSGDESSSINLKEYAGAYAVTYVKSDKIIAVSDVKSEFLTGTVKSGNIFKADGVEYKIDATATVGAIGYTFENGNPNKANITTLSAFAGTDTVTIAVERTGKTIDTLYSIAKWTAAGTFKFVEDDLEKLKLSTYTFAAQEDDSKAIDLDSFELVGAANLDAIAKDNIVTVYVKANKISKIEVGTKVVTGKITKVDTDDNFIINNIAYTNATGNYSASSTTPGLGDVGTARLNYAGDIGEWSVDSTTTGNYAVVMATKAAVAAPSFDAAPAKVKLFTKAGEEITLEVNDAALASVSALALNDLVKYAVNKDGELSKIEELTAESLTTQQLSKDRTLIDGKRVDSSIVVFVSKSATEVKLGTLADVKTETSLTGSYSYDGGSKIKVIYVNESNLGTSDKVYAVINTVENALNADDDQVQYVTGLADGNGLTAYTDGIVTFNYTTNSGLVMLTVDADGVITGATTTITSAGAAQLNVTVTAIDGGLVNINSTWYAVDSNVVIYQINEDGDAYEVSSLTSIKNLSGAVSLYKIDEDSAGFDLIVVKAN